MFLGVQANAAQGNFKLAGQRYTVFGPSESCFTQKVLVGCGWHLQGKFSYVPNATSTALTNLQQRAAVHEIPTVAVSGRSSTRAWALSDSTPILQLLDSRLPAAKFYPGDAFTVCVVLLLEDFFDKWMANMCIKAHSCRDTHVLEDAKEAIVVPSGGVATATRAMNMTEASDEQRGAFKAEFARLMSAFEAHHAEGNRFLLGDTPCAVDCVIIGGLRALIDGGDWPSALANFQPLRLLCDELHGPVPPDVCAQCLDPNRLPAFVDFVLRRSHAMNVDSECLPDFCAPYEKKCSVLRQSLRVALGTDRSAELALTQLLAKYALHDIYAPTAANL